MSAFSSLARNLFYSTSVAAAVIVLGVLAWTAWRTAAFATAMAVLPVAAVWLVSQGPHSYFVGRYLVFTVGRGRSWPGSGSAGWMCGWRRPPFWSSPFSARATSR